MMVHHDSSVNLLSDQPSYNSTRGYDDDDHESIEAGAPAAGSGPGVGRMTVHRPKTSLRFTTKKSTATSASISTGASDGDARVDADKAKRPSQGKKSHICYGRVLSPTHSIPFLPPHTRAWARAEGGGGGGAKLTQIISNLPNPTYQKMFQMPYSYEFT